MGTRYLYGPRVAPGDSRDHPGLRATDLTGVPNRVPVLW